MGPLRELLAVNHRQTLEFFVTGLQDVSASGVDRQQLLYNASVLAHYAQVSIESESDWPAPANLSAVFDQFVIGVAPPDGATLETAGAQCLVLSGFFEDQMARRHNIRWYAEIGAHFFVRASRLERSIAKARLLNTLATTFETWRRRHARLGRELRLQPYLLTLRPPASAP
jgi:hypothetical protein